MEKTHSSLTWDKNVVKTVHYDLFYNFYEWNLKTVTGLTNISFEFRSPIKNLLLEFDGDLLSVNHSYQHVNQSKTLINFEFSEPKTKFDLNITFCATINETPEGFFKFIEDVFESVFAQGEPQGIVKMLPCINYPKLKPTLKLYILTKSYHHCFANMPAINIATSFDDKIIKEFPFFSQFNFQDLKNYRLTEFKLQKDFPIHLFSICVGSFCYKTQLIQVKSLQKELESEVQLGFVMNHGSASRKGPQVESIFFEIAHFAINNAVNLFKIQFPYEKVDFAFVKFGFGAMENPGLITINLPSIEFIQQNTYFHFNRQRVVFHEICHSYFGNMLSIETFDDVWFKEGVTEFFSEKIHKNYHFFKTNNSLFAESLYQDFNFVKFLFMNSDLLKNPHPIVRTNPDMNELYSDTTYYKGYKVFRILSNLMDEGFIEEFLIEILKERKFGSLNTEEYFEHFTKNLIDKQTTVLKIINAKNESFLTFNLCLEAILRFHHYLLKSHEYIVLLITADVSQSVIKLSVLNNIFHPVYLEVVRYDSDFNEVDRIKAFVDLRKNNEISGFLQPFSENHYFLIDMENSGHFLCRYEMEVFNRLIFEKRIAMMNNSYMRYYIYASVRYLWNYFEKEDVEEIIKNIDEIKLGEKSPVFEYFRNFI